MSIDNEGIITGTFSNGQTLDVAALKIALERRPDVVLMDIRLRGKMDGVDTAIEIQGLMDVPIIYITAHTDEQTSERANSTNPSAFLKKPVEEKG